MNTLSSVSNKSGALHHYKSQTQGRNLGNECGSSTWNCILKRRDFWSSVCARSTTGICRAVRFSPCRIVAFQLLPALFRQINARIRQSHG